MELRTLSVIFDTYLEPWEIAKFRAAVSYKVGLEHEWYHNHKGEEEFLPIFPIFPIGCPKKPKGF